MQEDQRGAKEGCSGTVDTRLQGLSWQPKRRMGCPSSNIWCLDSSLANIIAGLQQLDREVRKVITQSGGKHPLRSTELMYLPGKHGGVEEEYILTKIKAAVKLYSNQTS